MENQTVLEHDTAVFTCEVNDEDVPVSWYLGGRATDHMERCKTLQEGRVHRLIISDTLQSDEGEVQAKVEDITTKADLFVEGT